MATEKKPARSTGKKSAAKKAEETGVEYTEDAAGTSLGDLLANIKL